MRLTFGAGPRSGQTIEVVGTMLVGRDEDCDLVLAEEKVSRHHARLTAQPDGTVLVEDLGSTNGTFVDGARIGGPATLRGGEELRIGSSVARAAGERGAAATVVRAPATVVAASAQPPTAAPPAAEGGRPWWRSRWALIGVVVGLIAVGGIVGGVLAATGGGDEDGAVAATEQAEEPETPAVTQPAVTEPPPETGGPTDTGSGGAPVSFTDAELALLAHIPESHHPYCAPYVPVETDPQVAAVVCELPDGTRSFSFQMDSSRSMNRYYQVNGGAETHPQDTGQCGTDEFAESAYSVDGVEVGRLYCFVDQGSFDNGPAIWWTHEPTLILSYADRALTDKDPAALYAFWSNEAGPV